MSTTADDRSKEVVIDGCYCLYNSYDCTEILCLFKTEFECCCMIGAACLAIGAESHGFGMVTSEERNECCSMGLGICRLGLKSPTGCCSTRSHQLCCKNAASCCPVDPRYIPEPVVASCCLQCMPNCGCCKPPITVTEGGAPASPFADEFFTGKKVETKQPKV